MILGVFGTQSHGYSGEMIGVTWALWPLFDLSLSAFIEKRIRHGRGFQLDSAFFSHCGFALERIWS